MSRTLFVSKPIAPPFNDGTKNLVLHLAQALGPEAAEVLGAKGSHLEEARVRPIYGKSATGHALGGRDVFRLVRHLCFAPLPPVLHWFFTPTRRTAAIPGRLARLRSHRAVWTLPSGPRERIERADLAAVSQVLVFSEATRQRLLGWGAPEHKVRAVRPWIGPIAPPSASRVAAVRQSIGNAERVTLFCGDLGPGRGELLTLEAFARARREGDVLVFATRMKGEHAQRAHAALLDRTRALSLSPHVRMLGAVQDMPALLLAADVVLLPATVLEAKVDTPLVLLEALALGRAVIVAEGSPPADLASRGAAIAVAPAVEPLALALSSLLGSPEERTRLGEAGRLVVLRDHSATALAQVHRLLYEEVLS